MSARALEPRASASIWRFCSSPESWLGPHSHHQPVNWISGFLRPSDSYGNWFRGPLTVNASGSGIAVSNVSVVSSTRATAT